ncbi:MAG: hypothetical protein PHH70_03405, partial [Candidatus Gracilibacteria bacterium]|nr:hypothetical protein [Candidatus Gracilibacteria bacterium]
MHESIIQNFTEQFIAKNWTRKDLLMALFENAELRDIYQNEIRRATVVGNIANEVLKRVGDTDFCKILAIGDIKYFDGLATEWQELVRSSLDSTNTAKLQGYDLGGLGSLELRGAIVQYMSRYYEFSLLPSSIENDIVPSYGGTDSFVTILNTLKTLAKGNRVNFIYPEASFLANVKIAELFLGESQCTSILKPDSSDFFFSQEQAEGLYKDTIGATDMNIFYITPVGNPTGNTVGAEKMYEVLKRVHELDPNAVFILDNVYVGLLPDAESHGLMAPIFSDTALMERIIFTESISKTLGTTG